MTTTEKAKATAILDNMSDALASVFRKVERGMTFRQYGVHLHHLVAELNEIRELVDAVPASPTAEDVLADLVAPLS